MKGLLQEECLED